MKSRFTSRSTDEEIMDDLMCSGDVVFQTLRELETINRLLGGNAVTLGGIRKLLNNRPQNSTLSVADIGCGGGDMLKLIARWGIKNNCSFQLTGIDANPNIVGFAKANAPADANLEFETFNIFSDQFKEKQYDIILATLFIHHFTNEQLVPMVRELKRQARIGVVINDIHRHWLAWYSIRLLTRLFSKSDMVKFDAPLSVLRAFSRKDLQSILSNAGIIRYNLKWKWAFRWQLIIPAQ